MSVELEGQWVAQHEQIRQRETKVEDTHDTIHGHESHVDPSQVIRSLQIMLIHQQAGDDDDSGQVNAIERCDVAARRHRRPPARDR